MHRSCINARTRIEQEMLSVGKEIGPINVDKWKAVFAFELDWNRGAAGGTDAEQACATGLPPGIQDVAITAPCASCQSGSLADCLRRATPLDRHLLQLAVGEIRNITAVWRPEKMACAPSHVR